MDAPPRDRTALSAQLEAALVAALESAWQVENHQRFARRMTAPVIALAEAGTRLGAWVRATRTIELARGLVLERPWPLVVGVLAHEMAHQYVDEVLGVRDETAHGETFRKVCAASGIDARAAGAPVAAAGADAEVDRVLERIRKLLALAGSANQHEAELAMRRAHELMLRHNIETARAHTAAGFEVRHVGDPTRRTGRVESEVVGLLARFFFVKAIKVPAYVPHLGTWGHVFELCGTRANVEMAVHVHGFLLATAERLWQANRGDARVRNGHDRAIYQSGVVSGFVDKLAGERGELAGTGLVWVGDAALDRWYHARYPRISRRTRRVRVGGAHDAGREAGRQIVLHRPVEQGASASAPRRLRG